MKFDKYQEAAQYILEKSEIIPEIAIVLGSGLNGVKFDLIDEKIISYSDIPNFPKSKNPSHRGDLHLGYLGEKRVAVLSGRFHAYEGHSFSECVIPIRVLCLLGLKRLILTNAAGAVNSDFKIGDIMIINDHIKLFGESPEEGDIPEEFGKRFFGMSNAYSKRLEELSLQIAGENDFKLCKGIYFYMRGPQFETPAEIRAIRILGGDAVGMSTVPEVITASKSGIETAAFSCITNMAAGITDKEPNDDEVVENGVLFEKNMGILLKELIKRA